MGAPAPRRWAINKVAGVTFVDGYPDNLHLLRDAWESLVDLGAYGHEDPVISAHLIRNPDNPHDANAIEVHAAEVMLGHVPRDIAAKIAPHMDAGAEYDASITRVNIHPDHTDRPGISLVATMKTGARTDDHGRGPASSSASSPNARNNQPGRATTRSA